MKISKEIRYNPQYWKDRFKEGKITHYNLAHRLNTISKRDELLTTRNIQKLKEQQDYKEYKKEQKQSNNETDKYLHFLELQHKKLFPKSKLKYLTLQLKLNRYIGKIVKQQVYEDNIKQYGTLTCYLCSKPIDFGEDSVDHIYPVSKGGSNEYSNLAIAHLICNIKKSAKIPNEHSTSKI